jgi:hypothetical protein
MAKKSYWEGWGFNDTFKVILTGNNKDVANGLREIKQAFPSSDSEKINAESFYVFVYDNELTLVKKIAKMFNLKVSYETGGALDSNKLVYVLYEPTPKGIKILNENGRTYLSWWQSDLTRGDSQRLLERLQIQNLILGGLRYTGDTSDLKFEQGGNIGEVLATSNPYIGGAKAIQGIAPESVSAIDKKMASRINPDPNRPIFFSNGGKTPKLEVGDKVIYPKDPKKRVGFISKITGSGMAFVDFVREGKVELFDLEDLKKTIRIPYSKGGKLEDFDINTLDDFEKMQYDRLSKMMSKSEALQVIINDVEGDYSQLSPKLSEIAEKQKFMSGGQVRKLDLHDAVLYNGETWFYTEKNGVKGITNTSQGAWGSNYPFIALSKLDVENDLTDMYGKKVKFDNGGTTGSTDYSVAQTILNQLGGMKRLVIMTGAYNFVASSNAVSFRIKNRKVNYIKITLNGNDLYDLKFSRIVKYNENVVKEYNDIYFDQLIPIFEETTGMYLRMFKKGGFINTQNRDMVISQLKAIHHHEEEMLNTLKKSGEVEAWVLAKVSNASSDLSDIAHYLEFKE